MKSGDLVVSQHQPYRRKLLLMLVFVLCALVLGSVYELGVWQGGYHRGEARALQQDIQSKLDALVLDNARLQEQLTITNRTRAIDGQAYNVVRSDLIQQQEEVLELRQEVEFYRGIVSPTERLAGINIQRFSLSSAGEESLFHYELVLTQMLKNDKFVKGVMNLSVRGELDDEPVTLKFNNISPNNSVRREFKFRYFQKFEGDIRLPKGFLPRDVDVEMRPKGRKQISQVFPWQLQGS